MAIKPIQEAIQNLRGVVDSATVIALGDLLWLDTNDLKPASDFAWGNDELDTQIQFAKKFYGVSGDIHEAAATNTVGYCIATYAIATVASNTFEPGDLLAVSSSGVLLLDSTLEKTTNAEAAIGYVTEQYTTATTSVKCVIFSPALTGWHGQSPSAADATLRYVYPGTGTLQAAIDAATAGDTLILMPGTYSGVVDLDKSLQIMALTGGDVLVQSTSNGASTFTISAGTIASTISGIEIQNLGVGAGTHALEIGAAYDNAYMLTLQLTGVSTPNDTTLEAFYSNPANTLDLNLKVVGGEYGNITFTDDGGAGGGTISYRMEQAHAGNITIALAAGAGSPTAYIRDLYCVDLTVQGITNLFINGGDVIGNFIANTATSLTVATGVYFHGNVTTNFATAYLYTTGGDIDGTVTETLGGIVGNYSNLRGSLVQRTLDANPAILITGTDGVGNTIDTTGGAFANYTATALVHINGNPYRIPLISA